ncbi:hypothetical protein ACLMJK_000737 [Lecanora helva]
MDGSDDFGDDDIWSALIRSSQEELFPDYTNDVGVPDQLPPGSYDGHLDHRLPPLDGLVGWDGNMSPLNSSTTHPEPNTHPRPHLDLPNFPLAPEHAAALPPRYRWPQSSTSARTSHPQTTTPSTLRGLPRPPSPSAIDTPPSAFDSGSFDPDNISVSSSSRSNSPNLASGGSNLDHYVDLTRDSSPPIMPPSRHPFPPRNTPPNRRNAGTMTGPCEEVYSRPAKRRKTDMPPSRPIKVEGIDLTGVDDDNGLLKVLEQQRLASIKSQQEEASKPVKLSTLQCIICMENMKDITATSCGHLFCHSCLMEALIAGENQGDAGKGIPKCPVCRKKVVRPSATDKRVTRHDVVPLTIKLKVRSQVGKGKERAVD